MARGEFAQLPLGEVCRVINGATPDTTQPMFWGGQHMWITPAEMGGLPDPRVRATRRTLTDAGLASCSATLVPANSVILSSRAPIGHVVKNTVPMATNQGCKALVPNPELLHVDYLYFFLRANVALLNDLGTGTTFKELSASKLKDVLIPLPSLEKQAEVVAKLSRSLDLIDQLRSETQAQLGGLGDVLSAWVGTRLEDDWPRVPFADACTTFSDGDWIESKDQSPTGIRLLQTGNVGVGVFKPRAERARYISDETFKRLRCTEVKAGDILISRLPDPVGRACVVPETAEKCITAVDCTIVRTDRSRLLPEFLILFTLTDSYQAEIDKRVTGTTRSRISRGNLGTVSIPLPPLGVQQKMLEAAKDLRRRLNGVERALCLRMELLDELRAALLHQAFTGEVADAA